MNVIGLLVGASESPLPPFQIRFSGVISFRGRPGSTLTKPLLHPALPPPSSSRSFVYDLLTAARCRVAAGESHEMEGWRGDGGELCAAAILRFSPNGALSFAGLADSVCGVAHVASGSMESWRMKASLT